MTNRWKCSHCGTEGFGGSIPPHDTPHGKSCRPSGQVSEAAGRRRFRPTMAEQSPSYRAAMADAGRGRLLP